MTIHHSFPTNGAGLELSNQSPSEQPEPTYVKRVEVVGGVAVTAYDPADSPLREIPLAERTSTTHLLRYL